MPSKADRSYITFRFPDRPRSKFRHTNGKSSGMGICQFIGLLFEANEVLPKSKKFTDRTIQEMIVHEFPDREPVRRLQAGLLTVGYWRTLYNQGLLTGSVQKRDAIPKPSRRYNEQGQHVNPRTGRIFRDQAERQFWIDKETKRHELLLKQVAEQVSAEKQANESVPSPQGG